VGELAETVYAAPRSQLSDSEDYPMQTFASDNVLNGGWVFGRLHKKL